MFLHQTDVSSIKIWVHADQADLESGILSGVIVTQMKNYKEIESIIKSLELLKRSKSPQQEDSPDKE